MALNANALTTIVDVQTYLDLASGTDDTLFESLINSFSDFLQRYLNTALIEETITQELHDGDDTVLMVLKNSPVTSITTIEFRTGLLSSPTWTAFSADDFIPILAKGLVNFPGGLPCGIQNLRVTYVTGLGANIAALPSDLQLICKKLVAKTYDQRRSEGKRSESVDNASVGWASKLTELDNLLLNNYKNHS